MCVCVCVCVLCMCVPFSTTPSISLFLTLAHSHTHTHTHTPERVTQSLPLFLVLTLTSADHTFPMLGSNWRETSGGSACNSSALRALSLSPSVLVSQQQDDCAFWMCMSYLSRVCRGVVHVRGLVSLSLSLSLSLSRRSLSSLFPRFSLVSYIYLYISIYFYIYL
jgi:hypothetical protein